MRDERCRQRLRVALPGDGRQHGTRLPERVLRLVPRRTAARRVLETGVHVFGTGRSGRGHGPPGERVRSHPVVPARSMVLRGLRPADPSALQIPATAAARCRREGTAALRLSPRKGRAGGRLSGRHL